MPKLFYKMIPNPIDSEQVKKIGTGKIISITLLVLFSLPFFVYGSMKLESTYSRISSNWAEIKFAYDRPALVREARQNYEKKQQAFEHSLLVKPQNNEQIVDAVIKKIESNNSLK